MVTATHILWIDLETTGADTEIDEIIEIGGFVTPLEYEKWSTRYYTHIKGVFKPSDEGLVRLMENPIVREMHTVNGLLAECVDSTLVQDDIQPMFTQFLAEFCNSNPERAQAKFMIAGSGVAAFDMPLVKRYSLNYDQYFDYRTLDVGHVRRFQNLAGVEDFSPAPTGADKEHRAMPDILASYNESKAVIEWMKSF